MSQHLSKDVVEKILKLLALSQDQAGKPEGQTAAKMAAKLMANNSVTEEDLQKAQFEVKVIPSPYSQAPSWYLDLWNAIAAYAGCYMVYAPGRTGQKAMIIITGEKRDIENTEYMSESLASRIEYLAEQWADFEWMRLKMKGEKAKKPSTRQKSGYKMGLVIGINARLADLTERVMGYKGDQSQALTIVEANEQKRNAAESFFAEHHGETRSMTRQAPDADAMRKGVKDAEKIQVNAGVGAGKKVAKEKRLAEAS